MKNSLPNLAKKLGGGHKTSKGWVCRCPYHGDKHASLGLTVDKDDGLVVYCFAGCNWKDVKDKIISLGYWNESAKSVPRRQKEEPEVPKQSIPALQIWNEAINGTDTLAHNYLFNRGYLGKCPATIRFHQSLAHPNGNMYPALIAAIVIHPYEKIFSVQRIYLTPEGKKADLEHAKLTLGPMKQGAVRLAPCDDIIGITEGIETGLSVMQATGLPVWCGLGAYGIANMVLPDKIKRVVIYADNDRYNIGMSCASKAAKRWSWNGKSVQIRCPDKVGIDYNDYFNFAKEIDSKSEMSWAN